MKGLNTTTFESKGAVKNEYKTIEHVIKKKTVKNKMSQWNTNKINTIKANKTQK